MEKEGTFLKIPLQEGKITYARIIMSGNFSFYKIDNDYSDNEQLLDAIANSTPIFSTYVFNNVFSDSKWEVIGWRSLEDKILNNPPVFFRQDISNWEECWLITTKPGFEKPITQ